MLQQLRNLGALTETFSAASISLIGCPSPALIRRPSPALIRCQVSWNLSSCSQSLYRSRRPRLQTKCTLMWPLVSTILVLSSLARIHCVSTVFTVCSLFSAALQRVDCVYCVSAMCSLCVYCSLIVTGALGIVTVCGCTGGTSAGRIVIGELILIPCCCECFAVRV